MAKTKTEREAEATLVRYGIDVTLARQTNIWIRRIWRKHPELKQIPVMPLWKALYDIAKEV